MVATISPSAFADLRRRGEPVTLIDVRTPAEFGEVHVEQARNIPLDRLDAGAVRSLAGDRPLYLICKSGGRSHKACEKLIAAGVGNVVSVEGGTAACEAAGLPVIRGRKAMSLERQVRIAAGSLVAIGAALAAFGPDATWRAVGAGVAGFVGCGLVFAGVTDTCGMAMILARMPWNRVGPAATACRV
ncbi:MAG: rhodanese-like domain-containing protein [Planctomycetes bacterium]|nr:rhodanese-like domain-containing protein [Planctomycetota bacterium]